MQEPSRPKHSLTQVFVIWFGVVVFLSYEYLVLHDVVGAPSILEWLDCKVFDDCGKISPHKGRPLSFALGLIGFFTICLTNLYVLRKHMVALNKVGKAQDWLKWHILFGLLGPTFIVFHCDFNVGGLVAISFWSMMVSFASGIVGRFLYVQVLTQKKSLRRLLEVYDDGFKKYADRKGLTHDEMQFNMHYAYHMAGGIPENFLKGITLTKVLYRSVFGGVYLAFVLPKTTWGGGLNIRTRLKEYALMRRSLAFYEFYSQMFGYWRTFHTPFVGFMYVVALIHIISSLIFKVSY